MKYIMRYMICMLVMMTMILCNLEATELVNENIHQSVKRPVYIEGDNKYSCIYLDREVYHYAKADLGDLRLIDEEGKDVPYYIYNEEAYEQRNKKVYSANIVGTFNKNDREYFDIEVEQEKNKDRWLTYLEISITSSNFASSVIMQGSYDAVAWDAINDGKEMHLYQVASGSQMRFYFNEPVKYSYFRMSMPKQLEEVGINHVLAAFEETQYYLQNYCEEKESVFEINNNNERKITVVTIENSDHLRISKLLFNIRGIFTRSYTLYGVDTTNMTTMLKAGSLYSTDINAKSSDIAINMDRGKIYDTYRVEIENLDDSPLTINQIKEVYYIDKLVFEAKGDRQYMLTYGDGGLDAPQYDIAYYAQDIEQQEQNIATFGEATLLEVQKDELKKEKDYSIILKIIIAITSLLLIVIIISNNKRMGETDK